MRLKLYYQFWSSLYESNVEKRIDEIIDLTTTVKKRSNKEWYFWVGTDLYVVRIGKRGKSHYELSFVHKDIESKEETSNLTDKHTPFSVMDGIILVTKEFIENKDPHIMEFNVFGDSKKLNMFKRVMHLVRKKFPDTFGGYNIRERTAKLSIPYDIPDELKNMNGIKITMEK